MAVAALLLAVAFIPLGSEPVGAAIGDPAAGDLDAADVLVDLADGVRATRLAEAQPVALEVALEVAPAAGLASGTEVEVRLLDSKGHVPAAGQRWHLIRTGDFDLGQRQVWWGAGPGGPYVPNPEPLASGVTEADGVVRFAIPPDDLVHLVTERSDCQGPAKQVHSRVAQAGPLRVGQARPVSHSVRAASGNGVGLWPSSLDESVLTGDDGVFELVLGLSGLARTGGCVRRLVAIAPDGAMAAQPLEPLPLGGTRDAIRIELDTAPGSFPFLRLSVQDPAGPIRRPGPRFCPAWLKLNRGAGSESESIEFAFAGDRAEVLLWPDRMPRAADGRLSGTLLWPGYLPLPIDLPAGPGGYELTLQRRPMCRIAVDLEGPGAAHVESLTVSVAYAAKTKPDGMPADEALFQSMSRDEWPDRTDMRVGVLPSETVSLLSRPGEAAFLRVTMWCSYGQLRSTSMAVPLGVLNADGSPNVRRVTMEAPAWGKDSQGSLTAQALTKELDSAVRYRVVGADTGEPLNTSSLVYESARGTISSKWVPSKKTYRVPAGQAALQIGAPGYQTLEMGPFDFQPEQVLDLGTLYLQRADTTEAVQRVH